MYPPIGDAELNELQHKILFTLRNVGMTIVSSGSEAEGHEPLDHLMLETAHLPYGTLVALVNDQNIDKNGQLRCPALKKEQVIITKYDWVAVAIALQTLDFNNHTRDTINEGFFEAKDRQIYLTKAGLNALITKFYLREREKENFLKEAHQSTLTTNKWMRILTLVIAVATIGQLIIGILNYNIEKGRQSNPPVPQSSQEQKKDTLPTGNIDTVRVEYSTDSGVHILFSPKKK